MNNVQEALKSAIDAMIMYQLKLDSTLINEAIVDCKAALAEIEASSTGISNNAIEKCEPVLKVHHGEICYKSQADDQSYGMWCPVNFDTEHTFKEGTEFFTSPQPMSVASEPREWVGLTYDQKMDLKENNDWYNFPSDLIEATEAKLKQLNTKVV